MNKNSFRLLLAAMLIAATSLTAFADVIHLKDGTLIRGDVVGFKDQQFIVLVGSGSRGGRRSRLMLYMEDVESIEFEAGGAASASVNTADDTNAVNSATTTTTSNTQSSRAVAPPVDAATTSQSSSARSSTQTTTSSSPAFFQVNARVRGDAVTNGWTNSGLVVRRGQRLRINATGRVSLGAGGRFSTPAGISTLQDRDKLMRNEPTGALIAVIGDDNDDFILVGRNNEFVATRDGVLFLGVNEGNLNDNTGAYDVVIEAEATTSATQR